VRFGLAYNFASGDGNPTDRTHTTFDNQYPLNHAYYGYMDFFAWQNMHNAVASVQAKLIGKLTGRLAYHAFWLAHNLDAQYNAGGGVVRPGTRGASRYVGSEIDVTLKYPLWDKRWFIEAGYSRFISGSFIQDTGKSEDADFFYLQTLIKF